MIPLKIKATRATDNYIKHLWLRWHFSF